MIFIWSSVLISLMSWMVNAVNGDSKTFWSGIIIILFHVLL